MPMSLNIEEKIDPLALCWEGANQPKQRKKKVMGEWFEGCTTCKECGKTFATRSSLEIHFRIHTGEKPYKCKLCSKAFTQKGHIKRHALKHQGIVPLHKCKFCPETFRDARAMKRHQTGHFGFEFRYNCDDCTKTYTRLSSLEAHRKIHADDKYFKCKQCPEGFGTHLELRRHVSIYHKKPPLKCEVCGKTYTHKSDLNIHSRSHSGARPYSCSICGKMFKCISHVNRHEKTHEKDCEDKKTVSKDKSPTCGKCGKDFNNQLELDTHECSIDSLFAFNCAICDNGYVKKKDLIRHMEEHSSLFEPIPFKVPSKAHCVPVIKDRV